MFVNDEVVRLLLDQGGEREQPPGHLRGRAHRDSELGVEDAA